MDKWVRGTFGQNVPKPLDLNTIFSGELNIIHHNLGKLYVNFFSTFHSMIFILVLQWFIQVVLFSYLKLTCLIKFNSIVRSWP